MSGKRRARPRLAASSRSRGDAAARRQEATLLRKLTREERKLIRQIQEALSFDLLNADMRKVVSPTEHYCRGHCYAAAEAFYYLYGQAHGFEPRGRDYHWWLENPSRGVVADPTGPQHSAPWDYSACRSRNFLPQSPKHASDELMRRVRAIQATRLERW
jgi:hypothetical protein